MTERYDATLVSFIGVNHHGQSVLLGCGLLASETIESYTWLFRVWLTCMLGRSPQTIITDQCRSCKLLSAMFSQELIIVFHCHASCKKLFFIDFEYEAIRAALHRAIYHSLRPEEFDTAWEDTIQRHGIRDHG